jgi:DNA-3-methyladenine glycosylase
LSVARDLLGKIIFRRLGNKLLAGMIVETEAYLGKRDSASHSFSGKTKRNEVMFGKTGKAYVYFTYGNHFCCNVVSGEQNSGCAVLIRAVEPLEGIDIMMKNRDVYYLYNLTNGPGKFAKAFAIDKELNGTDLRGSVLYITDSPHRLSLKIIKSARIGLTRNTDKLYRFYMANNPFVSRILKSSLNPESFTPLLKEKISMAS